MSEEQTTAETATATATTVLVAKEEEEEETEYSPWFKKHNRYPKIPVNAILDFLDSKSFLDIYQCLAFRIMINPRPLSRMEEKLKTAQQNYEIPNSEWQKAKLQNWWSHGFKFILCFCAVWISIVTLYFNIFSTANESERGWCSMNGNWSGKIAAVIYSILVSTAFSSLLFENQHNGFYWQLAESYLGAFPSCHYNFISARLLGFGRFMNLIVILNAFYLSILIIFWSDEPIDIILNAVALLFIADIDNLLVTSFDYEILHKWFQQIGNQYYCDVIEMNQTEKRFWNVLQKFGDIWVLLSRYILMFLAPLWVIVCY